MSESTSIIGRWRITEMDNWDQEAVDLVQPGFIEFDDDGLGDLGFIAVTGELDCRDADRDGRPGVEFSWQGSDEGDDVSGRGSAALSPDGTLEGMPPLVPSPAPASALLPARTCDTVSAAAAQLCCRVSVAIGIRACAARPVGHLLPEALQVGPGNRLPRSRQTPVQQGLLTPAEGFAQL